MQKEELIKLVSEIVNDKSEAQTIELKCAENGCPTRLFDTLSSFSNQDSGGIIIFGISEKDNYEIKGVYDVQDLQKKVNEQCKQMEPVVRALFTSCEVNGKKIVSAEIPSVDLSQRPVFYKGVGRIKGSYVRVGESDEPMSEYEIYSYEAFRKRIRDDLRLVDKGNISLFDKNKVKLYLDSVKRERKNLSDNVSDEEILELLGVLSNGTPTLAGTMIFCKYPQAYFPQLCITAVVLPGTEMGELGEDGERFMDNKRITGSISDMIEEAVDFVIRNSRTKTIIDDLGKREDIYEYPIKAIREAIINSLVHRDYSIYTENTPVRIEMYRDRIEITNSGAIFGKLSISELGRACPETRNASLANILEILKVTENRFSGIPTMRKECKKYNLPEPKFSVVHGEFRVIIRNKYNQENRKSKNAILEFCETPRSREEIIKFTGKSRTYTMTKIIQPLIDKGLMKFTIPEKPKSSKQKFVTV